MILGESARCFVGCGYKRKGWGGRRVGVGVGAVRGGVGIAREWEEGTRRGGIVEFPTKSQGG